MGWDPVKDAKKWFNRVKDEANNGINRLKNEANGCVNWIKGEANTGVNQIKSTATGQVGWIRDEAGKGVSTIKREVESIPGKAEEAVQNALKKALAAAASSTFQKAVDIAQVAAPDEMGLKVGPIGMVIGDVKNKIDTLQSWATNPPTDKSRVKEMIITLAPSSVSIEFDIQFAALVVSSDSLEVGFAMSWTTESFIEKFDDIIKEF